VSSTDFSLDDLPEGHPVITRDALSAIGEYAFTALRGFTLMGGQVKLDVNILSDMMLTGGDGAPSVQVMSILKPAALSFLEVESSLPKDEVKVDMERFSCEFDFLLSQKSYPSVINAMSSIAISRPGFFREAALCLARRTMQPPEASSALSLTMVKLVISQLRSSCVTLLRNIFSVTSNAYACLQQALNSCEMEDQARNALSAAQRAVDLMGGSRAEQNKAKTYYTWETSDSGISKETDDALAKLRSAKAARGLGNGIQLPTSMSDAVELVLSNLTHLPSKRPSSTANKQRKVPITLDFVIDAVLTNGACLVQEEGRWYERDGGLAWTYDPSSEHIFQLSAKTKETMDVFASQRDTTEEPVQKRRKLYQEQCEAAASDAVARIMQRASMGTSTALADFGNQIAARLAFTLGKIKTTSYHQLPQSHAKEAVTAVCTKVGKISLQQVLEMFVDEYPLVGGCVSLESTITIEARDVEDSEILLCEHVTNEAALQLEADGEDDDETDRDSGIKSISIYDRCMSVYIASAVHASNLANDKPLDEARKKAASQSASHLQYMLGRAPHLNEDALLLLCAMCDIEALIKKSNEVTRKTTQDAVSTGAAVHAAKVAAEKRATSVLFILRDTAFQRDKDGVRQCAVECAVGLAAGRLPSCASIQDKALKLVMNVLIA
jgi:symplekin